MYKWSDSIAYSCCDAKADIIDHYELKSVGWFVRQGKHGSRRQSWGEMVRLWFTFTSSMRQTVSTRAL